MRKLRINVRLWIWNNEGSVLPSRGRSSEGEQVGTLFLDEWQDEGSHVHPHGVLPRRRAHRVPLTHWQLLWPNGESLFQATFRWCTSVSCWRHLAQRHQTWKSSFRLKFQSQNYWLRVFNFHDGKRKLRIKVALDVTRDWAIYGAWNPWAPKVRWIEHRLVRDGSDPVHIKVWMPSLQHCHFPRPLV